LVALFHGDEYDAVATDDTKLARKFRMRNIPHVLPALLLYRLWRQKVITKDVALGRLEQMQNSLAKRNTAP